MGNGILVCLRALSVLCGSTFVFGNGDELWIYNEDQKSCYWGWGDGKSAALYISVGEVKVLLAF
jgi:hypothetical protein